MNNYATVMAIVEGATEENFINTVLAPYLGYKNIWMHATQISKPGQKGGDVRFDRVKNDIMRHLKQRKDTIVTLFLDFYGLAEWPGLESVSLNSSPAQIEQILCYATKLEIKGFLPDVDVEGRFIPFFIVHEFETLLFSNSAVLADGLGIKKQKIDKTLREFNGDLERINNSRETAPSKRIEKWMPSYKKTVNGIPIAAKIGVEQMRRSVPLFDEWITKIERVNSKFTG